MVTKIYVYNERKAGFYMYNGIFPIEVGKHNQTGKRFYVFTKERTKQIYEEWMKGSQYGEGKENNDTKQVFDINKE